SQTVEGAVPETDEKTTTHGGIGAPDAGRRSRGSWLPGTDGPGGPRRLQLWWSGRGDRRARRRERRRDRHRRHPVRHRTFQVLAAAVALFVVVATVSFLTSEIGKPGSLSARLAEWARDHGGGNVVADVENWWYSHHPPARGGKPPPGAIPAPVTVPTVTWSAATGTLPPPGDIAPLVTPAVAGEGVWHPAGRTFNGAPVVYEAYLRPDPVYTSLVAGVAWMDTSVLKASLYSGSYIPGGGPWKQTAPIGTGPAQSLVAAFNSGFRMQDAGGGYFTQGQMVVPLRNGAASIVIYKDGAMTVGEWGRDVAMSPNVVAVRQNLKLLVDDGQPAPDLSMGSWGATLGNAVRVWRSGLGVTPDGAILYAAGPGLDVPSLARLLQRAGAVRAMELDINTDWVNLSVYNPTAPDTTASGANGATLLSTMSGGAGRFFTGSWNRDFFTMSLPSSSGGGSFGRGRY
ncbi:MAG TPA: phosphodiester glycosidase family protein, partial [Acidimicrobiales bacterium]|nr:phosphodiester glycosidase family protein [Acidimicrobiales bacterium]